MFKIATALAVFAAVASALTPANTTQDPSGNPIANPGLGELIPAGSPFTITWDPTTPGSVSLLLLRGPSSNVVPIMTIADTIPNTGSYTWNVPTSLQPDTTGYGIQLIVEGTGQYQYSTQCGVSNPSYSSSSSSSSSISSTSSISLSSSSYYTTSGSTTSVSSSSSIYFSSSSTSSPIISTSSTAKIISANLTTTHSPSLSTSIILITTSLKGSSAQSSFIGTGTSSVSIPIVSPSGNITIPATLRTTTGAITSTPPKETQSSAAAPGAMVWNAGIFIIAALAGAVAL